MLFAVGGTVILHLKSRVSSTWLLFDAQHLGRSPRYIRDPLKVQTISPSISFNNMGSRLTCVVDTVWDVSITCKIGVR